MRRRFRLGRVRIFTSTYTDTEDYRDSDPVGSDGNPNRLWNRQSYADQDRNPGRDAHQNGYGGSYAHHYWNHRRYTDQDRYRHAD
jgi:hypothetical protein